MTFGERLFKRGLRLLPDDVEAEFGAAMLETFAMRRAERRQLGRWAVLSFTVRELAGLGRVVLLERAAAVRGGGSPLPPERRASNVIDHIATEVRQAARRLVRAPGFTVAAVATLALAIGANTAIFTLLHRIVLAPLPYADSDRLIALEHTAPGVDLVEDVGIAAGLYREYGRLPTIESIAMHSSAETTLSGAGPAERLGSLYSTPSLGTVLGVEPLLGRWFTESEGTPDSERVVVLSHALWQARFGGGDVIGTSLRLDGDMHEVIGVMPAHFAYPDPRAQLILPLRMRDEGRFDGFNHRGVARLKAGATIEGARREQDAVIADLPARFPAEAELMQALTGEVQLASAATGLKQYVLGSTARMLWVLLAAVGLVLLIACANVGNLFLVRSDARQREVAVRRALGAGAANVGAYFLAETALVSVASGAAGLLLGHFAVEMLVMNGPVELPRLHEVRIDATVVAFTAVASLIACIGFGLLPLVRRLPPLAAVLQDASRGNTAGGARMNARHTLMGAQVALAVVLLVAAGLMVRSVQRMWEVDPGFEADGRLVFRVGLPYSEYGSSDQAAGFHDLFMDRLRALSGVRTVGLTTRLPLDGDGDGDPLDVRGRLAETDEIGPVVRYRRVSADYFSAMGIPLRSGRYLDTRDADGATRAVVVNQALVDIYFNGADPTGQQVRKMAGPGEGDWLTVVGVVGNTPTYSLEEDAAVAKVYLPPRSTGVTRVSPTHSATYVIHTDGSPLALVQGVRRTLAELNAGVALARPEPLADMVARAGARLAFTMTLLVLAASAAVLLGLIGVYAVISYAISQRMEEIGLRMALGAQRGDVTGMIVRQSGGVVAAGVAVGVVVAAGGARLMQTLLFGVEWNDATTYVTAALGLLAISLLACWLPARRAAGTAMDLRSLFR